MGILNFLFKKKPFVPDFEETEYQNYLSFIGEGGTEDEWERLKAQNGWKFKQDPIEIYRKYQKEVKPVSDYYYHLLQLIQSEWSVLYNLNNYNGKRAEEFEKMCFNGIGCYMEMREIDLKYNKKTPLNVPAFTRLAMLYEKQGEYEKAVFICKEACALGIDQRSRLVRMIKKSGRVPNAEETALIENNL